MKTNSKIRIFLLCVSLLCITLFSTVILSSCIDSLQYVAETKTEYIQNIEELKSEGGYNYDYVSQYLRAIGTPVFDINKVLYFEEVFRQYYNLTPGLPDKVTHAILSAEYFVENYYDTVEFSDKNAVTDAVITSYVNVIGDVYSVYRPKAESDEHLDEMSGTFGGIGVTIEFNYIEETALIIGVNNDSPAERAGVAVGDYIYAVDDKTIEEIGFDNILDYTRGKVGQPIKLTVKRGEELISFTMTREVMDEDSVGYLIDEAGIGYIRIYSFKDNTYEQFVEAVDYIESQGARGVILDLRNNLGGYVDTAVDMLSYILPSDREIVSYDFKNGRHVSLKSADDVHPKTGEVYDHVLSMPMAVVCNGYTASAAEIFASTIRDYRDMSLLNAVLVGQTTYKKGILQYTFPYQRDGSSVTVTIAYYAPPSGECYHGIGITPDYLVENTQTEDRQLGEAYRILLDLVNNN